jgi:hypothetical protein
MHFFLSTVLVPFYIFFSICKHFFLCLSKYAINAYIFHMDGCHYLCKIVECREEKIFWIVYEVWWYAHMCLVQLPQYSSTNMWYATLIILLKIFSQTTVFMNICYKRQPHEILDAQLFHRIKNPSVND